MTNVNMLKSVMAANGDCNFVADIAELLNLSRTTASNKLNGKADFKQSEIAIIAERYKLKADDIKQIFIGT